MGSSSSKFRKYLQHGDEYAALHLYDHNSDLRKALDPNSSYGDNYGHDTPLHYAAKHGMKSLLRLFLSDHHGNPNKKNANNETSLHCACISLNGRNVAVQQRRLECLKILLQWRGAKLQDDEVEKVDLAAQDNKLNTALHYAAASGLKKCVELLVARGAPLFTENNSKQTPCDCAEKNNHSDIALYLESKMVFSHGESGEDDSNEILAMMETDESYSGLRAQDLQEAKDQLLVETSDMLRVPLFTAEALLRNHEWSREVLLEAWMDDAIACCEKSGVLPPSSLFESHANKPGTSAIIENDLTLPSCSVIPSADVICDICAGVISSSDELVSIACDHQFCRNCWERYLTGKIKEGEAHNITCPGYLCTKLVPVDIIETLVSRDMARRYLQFDIKAFVDSNPNIKWCPFPGCGRAVRLPEGENPTSPTVLGLAGTSTWGVATDTSRAVDCGNGHYFCWECLGEAHEPASCENWKRWHEKIAEIKPEELVSKTEEETELAANCLWLVTNSKPCPNCKSPIQKNEGCNHMKCSKCKHDFCWVCLEAWKKHSSATGGYFRCNRYEAVKKVEEHCEGLRSEAEAKHNKMQELNKFVHYYTRFKNHENSYGLEEPLVSTAKEKMMVLAQAVSDKETANLETKFVEDAVHQLLKARRVLKCSYVYGYYLEDAGYKKPIFEFMQTELEECTEMLSEMIARPYLRTPRSKIIQTAHLVQRKRHEFLTAISKGLVPPDSSPTLRKRRKKFSVELDEDLKKALLASIKDLDPENPWVKDPTGKHTNVIALLDWPEESDDSDSEQPSAQSTVQQSPRSSRDGESVSDTASQQGAALVNADSEEAVVQLCMRKGCSRPRATNPRTGDAHNHCSLRCMRLDKAERRNSKEPVEGEEMSLPSGDFHTELELLRALEMSRIQFLREMGMLQPGRDPDSSIKPSAGSSLEVELPPSPKPIKLTQPPQKQVGRVAPPALPATQQETPPTGFDADLERALQLSKMQLEEEDPDLKLAIELSLQNEKEGNKSTSQDNFQHGHQVAKLTDQDIGHMSASLEKQSTGEELLGACGGVPSATIERQTLLETDIDSVTPVQPPLPPTQTHIGSSGPVPEDGSGEQIVPDGSSRNINTFGIIKDISVNNIVVGDSNSKCSEFENKDFSLFYVKSPSEREKEQVFEPRPAVETDVKPVTRTSPEGQEVSAPPRHKKHGHKGTDKKHKGTKDVNKTSNGNRGNGSQAAGSYGQPGPGYSFQGQQGHSSSKEKHESMARAFESSRVGPNTIVFKARKTSMPEAIELQETYTSNQVTITGGNLAPMASVETLDQSGYDTDRRDSELDLDQITLTTPLLPAEPVRLNNEVASRGQQLLSPTDGNTEKSDGDDISAVYV